MARIGIAYDIPRQEEKMLLEAARRLGHDVDPIHVTSSIDWIHGSEHERNEDFVLIRCVSYYRALASAAITEGKGLVAVNRYSVIRDSGDKLVTTMLLAKNGLPVPRTAVAYRREDALRAARSMGYPVVVKPILGSWGRMIARAANADDLNSLLDFREAMNIPHFKIHYIQEYIDKPGRDIRAFYIWGEVPTAIYRVSENWKTNTALGARAEPAELSPGQVELVIKAGEALGGGILGIDLIEDRENNTYVSEVNAVVEFRNTVRVTGYDLAGKMIEETVRALRR